MKLPLFALMALALPLGAAEKADLTLTDGRQFKGARITTIGEQVTIAHAGGVATVDADLVPLDVLARADMAIKAEAAERAKMTKETARKDAERRSAQATERKRAAELAKFQSVPKLSPTRTQQQLIELKGRFPEQRKARIRSGEVLVPNVDIWHAMKSEVQVATLQSLPIAIRKVEERLAAEEAKLKTNDKIVRSTAKQTRAWFDHDLRPYLARLRSLAQP